MLSELKSGFRWYLPTFHGDILLTVLSEQVTRLRAFDLTPQEEHAMQVLRKKALKPGCGGAPWADEQQFHAISSSIYRTAEGTTLELKAPIEDVQKVLVKALRPNRKLLSAVRFTDGRIEEIQQTAPVIDAKSEVSELKPEAAVTVAAPHIGCPEPVFPEADVRAARVLEAFLTDDQRADFRKQRAFVARGFDTCHRYLVTDRERSTIVRRRYPTQRSLFDIDENRPLCVHDWEVPPPEEMLALMLCVQIPGRETYVRSLPATWH